MVVKTHAALPWVAHRKNDAGRTDARSLLRGAVGLEQAGAGQGAYLGACYSAEAYVSPALNVVSFPEGFVRAGADQIVGYLWPVIDEVAAELADEYYYWREHGYGLAEAVQRAGNDCLS